MTRQDAPLPSKHAHDDAKPEQADTKDAAWRHQERRARLFRQVSDNADDLYLRDLMIRYRGG